MADYTKGNAKTFTPEFIDARELFAATAGVVQDGVPVSVPCCNPYCANVGTITWLPYGSRWSDGKRIKTLLQYRGMTIDHRHPRAFGGGDELDNLWLLCPTCNCRKHTKSLAQFMAEEAR